MHTVTRNTHIEANERNARNSRNAVREKQGVCLVASRWGTRPDAQPSRLRRRAGNNNQRIQFRGFVYASCQWFRNVALQVSDTPPNGINRIPRVGQIPTAALRKTACSPKKCNQSKI